MPPKARTGTAKNSGFVTPTPLTAKVSAAPHARTEAARAAAVTTIARLWKSIRNRRYQWLLQSFGASETYVTLPWSPNDDHVAYANDTVPGGPAVPLDRKDVAWYHRLRELQKRVRDSRSQGSKAHYLAQVAYYEDIGRFGAACRMGGVLAISQMTQDPYHTFDDGKDYEGRLLPRPIFNDNELWPHLKPRFDGDRLFIFDTIVIIVVGGSLENGIDFEMAWRLYKQDLAGAQALADALDTVDVRSDFAAIHYAEVEYCGFKAICHPRMVPANPEPLSLVLGPMPDVLTIAGGPDDFPTLWKDESNREMIGEVLHQWEARNIPIREDLKDIALEIGIKGYPVVIDASDLPMGVLTTALLRASSGELIFRTPAEILPPEVLQDERNLDATRRWRAEVLRTMGVGPGMPKVPVCYRASRTMNAEDEPRILQSLSQWALQEMPTKLLDHIDQYGPPLDSHGWTQLFHNTGNNMRHIGAVAAKANHALRPALYREALARSAKWLYRTAVWSMTHWLRPNAIGGHAMPIIMRETALKMFNLVLGGGKEASDYWQRTLIPETTKRFGVPAGALNRKRTRPMPLFYAMQHHLGFRFYSHCVNKRFHDEAFPQPLGESDVLEYKGDLAYYWFPHYDAAQTGLDSLHYQFGYETKNDRIRGFCPSLRIVCGRGATWRRVQSVAMLASDKPDQAYQAYNMKLSLQQALGEPCPAIAVTLQEVCSVLMDSAKRGLPDPPLHIVKAFDKDKKAAPNIQAKERKFNEVIWAANLAGKLSPHPVAAWWGHLYALEAEWQLDRMPEARVRLFRMDAAWESIAPDVPLLRLRLDGVMTRLAVSRGKKVLAATHAERCYNSALYVFGGVHRMTIMLLARLGDIQRAHERWKEAFVTYTRALASAEALVQRDTVFEARIHVELGRTSFEIGEILAAQFHVEEAVKELVPAFRKGLLNKPIGLEERVIFGDFGGQIALDSVMLCGRIYKSLAFRVGALNLPVESKSARKEPELLRRATRCLEFYLKHFRAVHKEMGRETYDKIVSVVKEIFKIRIWLLGDTEKPMLVDAIESILLAAQIKKDRQANGVTVLDPRSTMIEVAESALSLDPWSQELEAKIFALCISVGKDAVEHRRSVTEWFDDAFSMIAAGISGYANPHDPGIAVTVDLLNLFRYFGAAVD